MSDSPTPTARRRMATATAMAYGLTVAVGLATYIPLYWLLTRNLSESDDWGSLGAFILAGSATLVTTALAAVAFGYRYVSKAAPSGKLAPVLAAFLVAPLISLTFVSLVRPWSAPAVLLLAAFPVLAVLWAAGMTRARVLVITVLATIAIMTVGLIIALFDERAGATEGYHDFKGPLAAVDGSSFDLSKYGLGLPESVARTSADDDSFWVRWKADGGRELTLQLDTGSLEDTRLCAGTYATNSCTAIGQIPEGSVYSNDGEYFFVDVPEGHWQLRTDAGTLTEAQALELLDSLEPVSPDTFTELALQFPPF